MSNLSQLLQQVIMRGTAPTTTITSDGNGNNKESTKIVWDGGMPERGELGERLSDYDYPTAAQWGGTTFGTGNLISNGSGNEKWYGWGGTHDAELANLTGGQPVVQPDVMMDPDTAYQTDQYQPDLPPDWADFFHGRPVSDAAKRRRDAENDKYYDQQAAELARTNNPLTDPFDSDLANSTGYTPESQAKLDAERKAAIKEKFKNVKGGDYSAKAVEESAEQAGQEYQDDLLSRYGDYDFAVQAAETRKSRLKRTNQVVMQGFMLDVMSQALGKKVGSQNYVENALAALAIDFKIGDEDQLQEVTKALYFRPDGTYDPPDSKDEAFQALTMMGLTSTEAAAISGKVSESQEYYVQDTSNPSGYRVVRKKPTGNTEYTTNASVADNKWGTPANATYQTEENRLNMQKKQLDIFQSLYPKVEGFFVNPEALMNALSTHGSLTQDTVDNIDPKSLMQLHFMVNNPQFGLSKSNVVEVDASQLEEMDKTFAKNEYYIAIVTGLAGGEPQLKERYGSG